MTMVRPVAVPWFSSMNFATDCDCSASIRKLRSAKVTVMRGASGGTSGADGDGCDCPPLIRIVLALSALDAAPASAWDGLTFGVLSVTAPEGGDARSRSTCSTMDCVSCLMSALGLTSALTAFAIASTAFFDTLCDSTNTAIASIIITKASTCTMDVNASTYPGQ